MPEPDYQAFYFTLRDAVLDSMSDSGRTEYVTAALSVPLESRLELLCDYLKHQGEHSGELDSVAVATHEMMSSFERAGFTRKEAVEMTQHHITTAAIQQAVRRDGFTS